MTEIIKDKVALISLDKNVLISYRLWIDLWDMGNDMNAIFCFRQPFFWYVRPSSCYAMQMPSS